MWKRALHSVSYAGVWPGQASLSIEEFIDHAADLGFDAVMLMAKRPHAAPLDLDDECRQALRDRLLRRGLELAGIAAYTDFTIGSDRPDIPTMEMQILYVHHCARLARDLGGRIVRIFTGYERPESTPHQGWLRCVAAVKECARRAADEGITLAVQNHHDIAAHHEALFDFLAEVDEPNAKAGFDAWAPTLQGVAGEAAAGVRRLAPFIVQTIVADYTRRPRFRYVPALVNYARDEDGMQAVPMGDGIVDYASFFAALGEVGFQGFVTYEMCSPLRGGGGMENLDRYARQFRQWMDQCLPSPAQGL